MSPHKERPKTRELIRWDAQKDYQILYSVKKHCEKDGYKIPWDNVGADIGPTVTGNAVSQHLAKQQKLYVKNGRFIINGPTPYMQSKRHKGERKKMKRWGHEVDEENVESESSSEADESFGDSSYKPKGRTRSAAPKTQRGSAKKRAYVEDEPSKDEDQYLKSPAKALKSGMASRTKAGDPSSLSRVRPKSIEPLSVGREIKEESDSHTETGFVAGGSKFVRRHSIANEVDLSDVDQTSSSETKLGTSEAEGENHPTAHEKIVKLTIAPLALFSLKQYGTTQYPGNVRKLPNDDRLALNLGNPGSDAYDPSHEPKYDQHSMFNDQSSAADVQGQVYTDSGFRESSNESTLLETAVSHPSNAHIESLGSELASRPRNVHIEPLGSQFPVEANDFANDSKVYPAEHFSQSLLTMPVSFTTDEQSIRDQSRYWYPVTSAPIESGSFSQTGDMSTLGGHLPVSNFHQSLDGEIGAAGSNSFPSFQSQRVPICTKPPSINNGFNDTGDMSTLGGQFPVSNFHQSFNEELGGAASNNFPFFQSQLIPINTKPLSINNGFQDGDYKMSIEAPNAFPSNHYAPINASQTSFSNDGMYNATLNEAMYETPLKKWTPVMPQSDTQWTLMNGLPGSSNVSWPNAMTSSATSEEHGNTMDETFEDVSGIRPPPMPLGELDGAFDRYQYRV